MLLPQSPDFNLIQHLWERGSVTGDSNPGYAVNQSQRIVRFHNSMDPNFKSASRTLSNPYQEELWPF